MDGTSAETPLGTPSTGQASGQAAPSTDGQESAKPVNLHELPEFRKIQSEYDRRMNSMQAEMARLAREAEEAKLATMDDYDKGKYMTEKYRQEAETARMELQRREQEAQRAADIDNLHKEYGVPKSMLEKVRTYDDAVALAKEYKDLTAKQVAEVIQQRSEKADRNAPDMGPGGYIRSDNPYTPEAQRALDSGDAVGFLRSLRQAQRRG